MNGKVSRALRHAKAGTLNIRDVGILSRRMAAESRQFDLRPKPMVERKRTPATLHAPTWPSSPDQRQQSRPVIVQRPMKLIHQRIKDEHTSFSNLTGGFVVTEQQAGRRLPKHLLDRMALAA